MINIIVLENQNVGEDYRDAIKKFLVSRGMENCIVKWFTTIKETIEYAKENNVQLLVFDQRLNAGETGSDAFKALREINERTHGIMITGVATLRDWTNAQQYGPCLLVEKDIKTVVIKLIQAVEQSLTRYFTNSEGAIVDNKVLVKAKKIPIHKEDRIEYSMLSYYLDEEEYIPQNGWKTDVELVQGITKKHKFELKSSATISVSNESTMLLENTNQAKLGEFESELMSHFENTFKSTFQSNTEISSSYEDELSGPDINPDTSKKYITCIQYKYADTFKKYIVHCLKTCKCCESKIYFDYAVLIPNKMRKRKMETHYSTGEILVDYL